MMTGPPRPWRRRRHRHGCRADQALKLLWTPQTRRVRSRRACWHNRQAIGSRCALLARTPTACPGSRACMRAAGGATPSRAGADATAAKPPHTHSSRQRCLSAAARTALRQALDPPLPVVCRLGPTHGQRPAPHPAIGCQRWPFSVVPPQQPRSNPASRPTATAAAAAAHALPRAPPHCCLKSLKSYPRRTFATNDWTRRAPQRRRRGGARPKRGPLLCDLTSRKR
ncbi:MAG: hypothetical protein J3K34DRAFT_93542 [Monoraphidium minutum]|nr:MAG: hypothetical protein J3K34DRAFT_93542 [Monoraphidium minutum]